MKADMRSGGSQDERERWAECFRARDDKHQRRLSTRTAFSTLGVECVTAD